MGLSTHLGDGAYVTCDSGDAMYPLLLTANHHDPAHATDKVYIETRGVLNLLDVLAKVWPKHVQEALDNNQPEESDDGQDTN